MVGYPYFYNNLSKDMTNEKLMILSCSPIAEDSENLLQLFYSSLVLTSPGLKLGDEFNFTFCKEITKVCNDFCIIPENGNILLDYEGFCQFISKSELILDNVATELQITPKSAVEQAKTFFKNRNVIVQATGVQGCVYKLGFYFEAAGSAAVVANTLTLAKLAGVSGFQVLKAQPILAIAIPTTGAMFFYGCATIAANTTLGKVLTSTGDVLAFPLKGMETLWNSYINRSVQKIFGIPIILNMTQAFKTGQGYTIEEVSRYIDVNKKSIIHTLFKWFSK